jgi:anaerobic selenocysteine-containing dehydrogenase
LTCAAGDLVLRHAMFSALAALRPEALAARWQTLANPAVSSCGAIILRLRASSTQLDPRNVGLANKADLWLRVRPGTDGALSLGLADIMIEREWYDQQFVRAWSNGPLLVRSDTDRLLKAEDLVSSSGPGQFVAWNSLSNCIVRSYSQEMIP